jgi:uncharacterized protein (DUF169 family)
MEPLKQDLSVFDKLNLANEPIGVKFLYRKPVGIKRIGKPMAICEMLREAQSSDAPFYITAEDEDCFGAVTLGMKEMPPFAEAGELGYELDIFSEPRANGRLYNFLPKMQKGVINAVVLSPMNKLTFEPDLLILNATVSQAEIVLRAMDYLSGGLRESKTTGVFGCSWLFTYPFQTGKINYTVTGLAFGMKAKKVFPEGQILFSIPYDWIPILIHNMNDMIFELPSFKESVKAFKERENRIIRKLTEEADATNAGK